MYPSTYLEPGLVATHHIWNGLPTGSIAQAQQNISRSKDDRAVAQQQSEVTYGGTALLEAGSWRSWATAEVAAAVGAGGHIVLQTDVANGKTTIYFAGESEDEQAKAVRAHAKKIKLADVTTL